MSFGALITILGFGLDPFVQQTVSVPLQSLNSTAPATIGRAQSFLIFDRPNDLLSRVGSIPQPDVMGAIYSGLFAGYGSADQTLTMNANCPTGNCTFPTYQSLAVCSTCQDINHALVRNCSKLMPSRKRMPVIADKSYCTLSLPNGLHLNQTGDHGKSGAMASSGYLASVDQPTQGNVLFSFTRIMTRGPVNSTANATQCSLSWCIKQYDSTVTNGRLAETSETWYVTRI